MNKLVKVALFLLVGFVYSAKAQITKIPFDFNSGRILMKVQFNKGDSLLFIFDTGATASLIDSLSAVKAGADLQNSKNLDAIGSGGAKSYPMIFDQKLNLPGNVELDIQGLFLMNLTSLKVSAKADVNGLIGYDLLNRYVTSIDFDRRIISLYEGMTEVDTTGYTGIPFEFNKGVNIPRFPISITLNNKETYTGRVMFDSGAELTLLVSAPFNKFHNLSKKIGKITSSKGRGLNFETDDENALIKSMHFNGFKFGKMAVELTKNDAAEPKDGYLGMLGIDIIKRFNVIMDYANKKIYLKPNASYNDPLSTKLIGTPVK